MTTYSLTNGTSILRSDGASIPPDPTNVDYQAFLVWQAAGNVPTPYVAPPPTQDQLDVAAAKAYAKLTALKTMTPAQIQAWVTANVTTLAAAQDAIATLAIAVAILARRL